MLKALNFICLNEITQIFSSYSLIRVFVHKKIFITTPCIFIKPVQKMNSFCQNARRNSFQVSLSSLELFIIGNNKKKRYIDFQKR